MVPIVFCKKYLNDCAIISTKMSLTELCVCKVNLDSVVGFIPLQLGTWIYTIKP